MVGEDASRRARVTCFYLKDEEVAVLFAHAEDARLRNAAEAARKRLGPDWELRHKVAEMHSQEPSPEVQATRDKAWRMVARSQERELREIKARVDDLEALVRKLEVVTTKARVRSVKAMARANRSAQELADWIGEAS